MLLRSSLPATKRIRRIRRMTKRIRRIRKRMIRRRGRMTKRGKIRMRIRAGTRTGRGPPRLKRITATIGKIRRVGISARIRNEDQRMCGYELSDTAMF